MVHYVGIDEKAVPIIRRALAGFVLTKAEEIAAADAVVAALDEAHYSIVHDDDIDGAVRL